MPVTQQGTKVVLGVIEIKILDLKMYPHSSFTL